MIRLPIGAAGALIGAATAGIALAPFLDLAASLAAAAGITVSLASLAAIAHRLDLPAGRPLAAVATAILAGLAGLALGDLRLAAIDGGALTATPGARLAFEGNLTAPPRPDNRGFRMHLHGPDGRAAVLVTELDRLPPVGTRLRVRGRVDEPPDYLSRYLARQGIRSVIRAERLEIGPPRGGPAGLLDRVRERALAGMGAGMPPREAALAAGFVLGQDAAIDAVTADHFKRSGLSHLVAASGQNVMLLVLLGTVPLALAGVPLRRRVPLLIGLVLVYLPLTGAGPSIQRAAIMGIVSLTALWLGGAGSRLIALLVAVGLTLLANPRASGDVGWQLSFAATTAIMLLAPDLSRLLLCLRFPWRKASVGTAGRGRDALHRLLADGTAVTVAATLATAPLIAHHFGAVPLASLTANLLALPAVAPAMWLGMLAGLAGQLPGIPTEAINWLNALLIAYIAEVAAAISELPGSVLAVGRFPGWAAVVCQFALLIAAWFGLRRMRGSAGDPGRRAFGVTVVIALVALIPVVALFDPAGLLRDYSAPPSGMRLVALDVGQGDAILIQTGGASLLVDTGPPGAGIVRRLRRYGVKRLDAVFITHADLDHVGGLAELRDAFAIDRLLRADPLAGLGQVSQVRLVRGQRLRLGEAEIEVLWPPSTSSTGASVDRNARSLVLLFGWRGFKALLTGDAEAEAAPYTAGDIDLIKVAHHGSADHGLPSLLADARPELALISVGKDNRHGHPHPATLAALSAAGVRIHRTDLEGDLVLELESSADSGSDHR